MSLSIAMIADVVKSSSMKGRQEFAGRLSQALDEINAVHAGSLRAPLRIAKGIDTISGVVGRVDGFLPLALELMLSLKPADIRIAFALGGLDVNPESGDPREIDGEAFHLAQQVIETIEADRELLGCAGFGRHLDPLLRAALALLGRVIEELTPRQSQIVLAYRRAGSQDEVAARMGVSQQAVSDALRKARHDLLDRGIRRIHETLLLAQSGGWPIS